MPNADFPRFLIVLIALVCVMAIISKIVDYLIEKSKQKLRIKAIVSEMALRKKDNALFEYVEEAQRDFENDSKRGRKVRD